MENSSSAEFIQTHANETYRTNDSGLFALRIALVCSLYLPLAAITVLGNIFVLASYKRDERIRNKKTNTFILNLAIADLLVGLVMLINTPKYVTDKWYFGREFCIIVWAIDYISTDMSVITIIAISIDRYLMIRNSIQHRVRQSRQRIILIFTVMWFLCICLHTSLAFVYSAKTGYKYLENQRCNLEYRREKWLVIALFLIEFVLPVICLVFVNTKVLLYLYRRGSRIKLGHHKKAAATSNVDRGKDNASGRYLSRKKTYRVPSSPDGSTVEFPNAKSVVEGSSRSSADTGDHPENTPLKKEDCEMRIHSGSSSSARSHKAAKLLTAIIIVFIISWLPYFIYDCYILIHGGDASDAVTQTLTFILWGNSAVNPVLYAFADVHYRQNFKHFLRLGKGKPFTNGRINE